MKKSELLKKVLELAQECQRKARSTGGVCVLVGAAADNLCEILPPFEHFPIKETAYKIRRQISESIAPHTYVNAWLVENSPEFRQWCQVCTDYHERVAAMTAYRIRWIEQMIADYEAAGD